MSESNVDLKGLQQQVAEKKRLEAKLQELYTQQEMLEAQTQTLERAKLNEQADVDRLEGRSLAAFFYNVVGKLDQKLDKERQEAYAAQVKYDAAARELDSVQADIARCEDQTARLAGCEERRELPFHKMLLNGELPLTMGGGIGQSRLCMLMIGTCHIGEVQSSLWDEATQNACRDAGILLL